MHRAHSLASSSLPRTLTLSWTILLAAVVLTLGPACTVPLDDDAPETASATQPVVYGDDNRLDYYDAPEELQALTRGAIVALMRRSGLDRSDPEGFTPTGRPLGRRRNLCEGERFADQPTAAFCSGTLIGPDLVLTAGHCVETQSECLTTELVFDYFYRDADELETITEDDVFTCSALLAQANNDEVDYAILRLDRPVSPDRTPVAVRTADAPLQRGEPLVVVGFGSGLPAKIDQGGTVVDPRADDMDYFEATLDTFGGNSGSGIFDQSLNLVGILVRGETDYITVDGCQRVNVLGERGREDAEDATYVARALEHFCSGPSATAELCPAAESFLCGPCADDSDCQGGRRCLLAPVDSGVDGSGSEGSGTEGSVGDGSGSEGSASDGSSEPPASGICVQPCELDRDCPTGSDLECIDGLCLAPTVSSCVSAELSAFERCAPLQREGEVCALADRCVDDTCVPRLPGDLCDNATPLPVLSARYSPLGMAGYTDLQAGSCAGAGAERVFAFDIVAPTQLVAEAGSVVDDDVDVVLHLRRDVCEALASEQACRDDSTPPGDLGSRLNLVLLPGRYFLFLDSFSQSDADAWLDLSFSPACQAGCEAEAGRCDDGLPQRCEVLESIACGVWLDRQACDADESCEGGACVPESVEPEPVEPDAGVDDVVDSDAVVESDAADSTDAADAGAVTDDDSRSDAADELDAASADADDDSREDAVADTDAGRSDDTVVVDAVTQTDAGGLADVDGSGTAGEVSDGDSRANTSGCATMPAQRTPCSALLVWASAALISWRRRRTATGVYGA